MSAAQAVKQFRLKELKGLPRHILRFGPLSEPAETDIPTALRLPNPFVPRRNPHTGRWIPPKYSLRRQAELIKRAKEADMLQLLPPGPKCPRPTEHLLRFAVSEVHVESKAGSEEASAARNEDELDGIWMDSVDWEGKADFKQKAGADIGTRLYSGKKRMFKGHKWERMKEGRDIKRKILMRDMARRVRNYKAVRQTSHSFRVHPCSLFLLQYYQRRKPNPLKPSSSAKARKLPF
jgi:large subunit ribosomal protein L25